MTGRLDALLLLQTLDRVPRLGWIQRGIADPESVGAHSFGTALLALALAPGVDPPVDVDRVVSLALVHDLGEARIGDIPRTGAHLFPPGAKHAAEERALAELLAPLSQVMRDRATEALAGESREARLVEVLDKLQLGLRLLAYTRTGVRGLDEFRAGLERLECGEFAPCEELRREILTALEAIE